MGSAKSHPEGLQPSDRKNARLKLYAAERDRRKERSVAQRKAHAQEVEIHRLLQRYDVTQTGTLTREEVTRLAKEILTSFTPMVGGVTDQDIDMIMRCGGDNVKLELTLEELPQALAVMASVKENDEQLVNLFELFDVDRSGNLPADQLKALLTKVNGGAEPEESDVNYILLQCEPRRRSDPIQMDQLKAALGCWYCLKEKSVVQRMKETFDAADVKGNGVIERDELKILLQALDSTWTDQQLEDLVSAAFEKHDTDKTDSLDYDQFINWLLLD